MNLNQKSRTHVRHTLLILSCVVTVGILISRLAGKLYPIFPSIILITTVGLLLFQVSKRNFSPSFLIGYVFLSSFYRVYAYLYPPSFIGADSDGFALLIVQLQTGSEISSLIAGFYGLAPLYLIFGKISTLITGNGVKIALFFIPLSIGIMFPLISFVLAREIPLLREHPQIAYMSAAVTVMAPTSMSLSTNPIPQSLASIIALITIVSIYKYIQDNNISFIYILVISYISIIFTHKLSPTLVSVAVLLTVITSLPIQRSLILTKNNKSMMIIGAFMIGGVYLQHVHTGLLQNLFEYRLFPGAYGRSSVGGSSYPVELAAEPLIGSDMIRVGLNVGYQIPMYLLAGIGWIYILRYCYNQTHVRFILSIVALGTSFAVLSYVEELLNITIVSNPSSRFLLLIIPFLSVLISFSFAFLNFRNFLPFPVVQRLFVVVLIMGLFSGQAFTTQSAIDGELNPRQYLNQPEIYAKSWGDDHIRTNITTDGFYSKEIPPSMLRNNIRGEEQSRPKYRDETLKILSGSLSKNHTSCTIAIRPDVRIYSYRGRWRAPRSALGGFETHNSIYSSGKNGAHFYQAHSWQRNCT